jgi:hypothetical protein
MSREIPAIARAGNLGLDFDTSTVPNPRAPARRSVDHGRGIYVMKVMADEVHFESGGTEISIRKRPPNDTETFAQLFVLEIRRS